MHHERNRYYDRKLEQMRRELEQLRKQGDAVRKSLKRTRNRLEWLEEDVPLLTLFARATLDVLEDKGSCTIDEVKAAMREIDTVDGKPDGGLDPKVLADELGMHHTPDKKALFAGSLEEGERLSPEQKAARQEAHKEKLASFQKFLQRKKKRRRR